MKFVELNRYFVRLEKNQEPSLDIGRMWGRPMGGWLTWAALRDYRRVVVLAEAATGKSEEFRNQARSLSNEGKAAFIVRIEELADQGFEAALDPGDATAFEQWLKGATEGWFFLDSIDEARLNRKSLETALKRFARDLNESLDRAHVFISCRVTDWKGNSDRSAIARLLPAHDKPKAAATDSKGDPLLDPIFEKKSSDKQERVEGELKPSELLIVQIAPLQEDQYRALASEAGVTGLDNFVAGIARHGLDTFTERPGDILALAAYWNQHGKFDSLSVMTEHAISHKLRELDPDRADSGVLSSDKARTGAERIAGALTLGKSFTLRVPGHDPDPSLASGAIDPSEILPDWNDAECSTLVRRGVFAPATYGRVRFHHRTTQEYLAATWLLHLLNNGSPRADIWNLFFTERYGVDTIVPSLRPVAAWMASRDAQFRDEVLRREPLVLIQHGDPASLPLPVKEQLLRNFAKKQAAGEISDDSLDRRAVWMFADPRLTTAIREAWSVNDGEEFRLDLLRFIREGEICECIDLARSAALDPNANTYSRIVAIQSLRACNDAEGLELAAKQILAAPSALHPRVAVAFAEALFPQHLDVEGLMRVIVEGKQESADQADGFSRHLLEFNEACPNAEARTRFIGGLAELAVHEPYVVDYQRISQRYIALAKGLEPVARAEVQNLGAKAPTPELLRLLTAVERADQHPTLEHKKTLAELVRAHAPLNRALLWADAEDRRAVNGPEKEPIRHWQVFVHGTQLWAFSDADLSWLYEDLRTRELLSDRRIALSAIVTLLASQDRLQQEAGQLRQDVAGIPLLESDLESYLKPQEENEHLREHRLRMAKHDEEFRKRQAQDRASWEAFKAHVVAHPDQLRDRSSLRSWKAGAYRLRDLGNWLHHRVGTQRSRVPREWRLLSEGFGQPVAEAYRDGMKGLWRVTQPERPKRKDGNAITVKWLTIMAFEGVGIEASEDNDWIAKLSPQEVERAAQHGCYSDQGHPEWIDDLMRAQPQIVIPILRRQLTFEWKSTFEGEGNFLNHYGYEPAPMDQSAQQLVFEVISSREPKSLSKLKLALRILRRLQLDDSQKRKLARLARKRLANHTGSEPFDWPLGYLAMLLIVDMDGAINDLERWLQGHSDQVEVIFAKLFDRDDASIGGALDRASPQTLERLLELAYQHVSSEKDVRREDVYTPNTRDRAENARNTILTALLNRPGADAYRAFSRAIEHPALTQRARRFRELARGKAERDTEFPAWTGKEVVTFERECISPVKTGHDLFRVVLSVLEEIRFDLTKGDVTSRPLLERAHDEDEVQNWLVEQMNFRAKGRFRAFREAKVADGDKPDVIVSSTAAPFEVAIEVKHGGMGWTWKQLENALRTQLAENYLKPEARRQGVLVITNHGARSWRDPESKKNVDFATLIQKLDGIAKPLIENDAGAIELRCIGIDATVSGSPRKSVRNKS